MLMHVSEPLAASYNSHLHLLQNATLEYWHTNCDSGREAYTMPCSNLQVWNIIVCIALTVYTQNM